jgi:hypothetical protein
MVGRIVVHVELTRWTRFKYWVGIKLALFGTSLLQNPQVRITRG